jgi:hypothetical protein
MQGYYPAGLNEKQVNISILPKEALDGPHDRTRYRCGKKDNKNVRLVLE